MKYFAVIFLVSIIAMGCKKDEILISGDIEGHVKLIRVDYSQLPPQKDIQVDLYSNSVKIDSKLTDKNGNYSFKDISFGRYLIQCNYPDFIGSYHQFPTYHIGGYSPTIADYDLHQVPGYQIQIDSISHYEPDDYLKIHLKVDGDTLVPGGTSFFHQFMAFMSNSPDVSTENYEIVARGTLADWDQMHLMGSLAVFGRIFIYDYNFEGINKSPIYMIIYPVANNQSDVPWFYLPGSLGPASNEIVFNWPVISGE